MNKKKEKEDNQNKEEETVNTNPNEQKKDDEKIDENNEVSIKPVLIILIAIIAIFILIIALPKFMEKEEKSLEERHMENYENKPTEDNFIYNGHSFIRVPDPQSNVDFWYTQYKKDNKIYDIPMRHSPLEVDHINKTIKESLPPKSYEGIYITINPEEESNKQYMALAASELSEKFVKIKNYPIKSACTVNKTVACHQREIVNCTNREEYIVMQLINNRSAEIVVEGNCIKISGKNETLVQAVDRVIYGFLGIME